MPFLALIRLDIARSCGVCRLQLPACATVCEIVQSESGSFRIEEIVQEN